ncbi:MAG: NAD(P)/FAD-dependent oxidoreductase [Candidatus Tectomicrobia bacterium]|uniref:NAD(P)/FAD-dependent oxidoreductase n=1 Tax=Tectimicrobiota bacterium TaxID=2528274 RepID=A0A932GQW2_UNCTE|nr:NAD(P)/FAD-dependent oxidoreductase [Candidatus Tectomicrobia bacterium]
MERYDVIIAGASFGGLAVATQLKGKVLLIEPHSIGETQTSACGTLLDVPKCLGLMGAVLQVQNEIAVHTPSWTQVLDVSRSPFCTFDYPQFCQGMVAAARAQILHARVLGCEGNRVVTNKGRFEGDILVDASGWRRVLGNSVQPCRGSRRSMSFGIETTTPRGGEKLCFWFDPVEVPKGVAWFFPIDRGSRVGVGAYTGKTRLGPDLQEFLDDLTLSREDEIHGGYFPSALGEPTMGNLFLVGDAAGQCLPLTGEGIRPAIYFGLMCGAIIQEVLEGKRSLPEGLSRYRETVLSHRKLYWYLQLCQRLLIILPRGLASQFLLRICREPLLSLVMRAYIGFTDFERIPSSVPKAAPESAQAFSPTREEEEEWVSCGAKVAHEGPAESWKSKSQHSIERSSRNEHLDY